MLEVRNIEKRFGDHLIFRNVSFRLNQSEIVALVGKSGCGKSTLSNCIMGLISIDSGSIFLEGERIDEMDMQHRKHSVFPRVQMIVQNSQNALHPQKKVITILQETVRSMSRISDPDAFLDIEELLPTVGLDNEYLEKKTYSLSGGELQRICIARVLLVNPNIIIADEPFSSVDSVLKYNIFKIFQYSVKMGKCLFIITHDLDFALRYSDRILFMNDNTLTVFNDLSDEDHLHEAMKRGLI